MAYALLALGQLAGLLLIPFGLPGTWVQVGAVAAYGLATGWTTVGWPTVVFAAALAVVAEVFEWVLGARYARLYGGSPRAAWGAILGGIAGAVLGLPVPVVGSVVGAFAGAFAGAAALELTRSPDARAALRVGWGAFVGRLVATAVKAAIGVAIGAAALFSALG
jgi:uncharacterized protein